MKHSTIQAQMSKRFPGMILARGQATVRGVRYKVEMRPFSTVLYDPDLRVVGQNCTVNKAAGGECPDGARAVIHTMVLAAIESVCAEHGSDPTP